MCSACITISPAGSNSAVEASRRSLMLAEWAERISTAPISSQVARSAPTTTCSWTGSSAVTRPLALARQLDAAALQHRAAPAGRHQQRRLGQLADGRPVQLQPRRQRAAPDGQLDLRAAEAAARRPGAGAALGTRVERQPRPAGRRADDERPHAHRHQLDLLRRVAVAVAALVRVLERLAQAARRRSGGPSIGQLERLAAVAQRVGRGDLRVRRRRAPRAPGAASAATSAATAAAVSVAPLRSTLRCASRRRRRDDEAEGRQHAGGARREHAVDPQLLGDRGGVQRAGAAEGDERVVARVDPALDRHDPQRPRHLGVGDAHDPLRAGERLDPQLARQPGDRGAGGVEVERDRRRQRRVGRQVAEQQVGVGDGRQLAAAAVAGGARHGAGRRAARRAARRRRRARRSSRRRRRRCGRRASAARSGGPRSRPRRSRRRRRRGRRRRRRRCRPCRSRARARRRRRRAAKAAPSAPPAGPERTVQAAWPAAAARSIRPPLDCMIAGSGRPASRRPLGEPAQVAADRAATARRRSRSSPPRSYSRKVPTTSCESETWASGSARASASRSASSCCGMAVGVQQRDRDRLGRVLRDAGGERGGVVGVERSQRAVGRHPLGRLEAQLGGTSGAGWAAQRR